MKATSILILYALIFSIGWGILRDIRRPKENSVVSYNQEKDREPEVTNLMETLANSLPDPKDKRLVTKSSLTSLYYV